MTTITIGSCVSIQGAFVKQLSNGFVQVRVGDRLYSGRPVRSRAAA
ncbi:hypothetical protein roselon_00966 [Roseibacterium elongatum DSM 19469]|uniref:Translation initiation factor 2 n=1 Tax=Roseicyclus elongatus DSM 19469 TaxID=1294273 RepID=W8S3N1_9RHOB|nr:hypothetical protein roselon_00966 [Roseibacterium elongatum DSM 19469]